MTKKLNALQLQVVKHYANGEYSHCETIRDVKDVCDTLLLYCVNEAEDAEDADELLSRLNGARDDLEQLRDALCD